MKEVRFFYDPQVSGELPEEEARHVLRVLRLKAGDIIHLMDGKGSFYEVEITTSTNHRCLYRILDKQIQPSMWSGHLHLAMAPTKMMERVEWFAEKATEIGFDELSFLSCCNSERRTLRGERIEKILVSAVKQSHKAWLPRLNEMTDFNTFVTAPREGQKLICHCYANKDISSDLPLVNPFLMDVLKPGVPVTVLIGPEGDFSVEEVCLAIANGYECVSLGRSRLRTETAALVAVHCMQQKNMIYE